MHEDDIAQREFLNDPVRMIYPLTLRQYILAMHGYDIQHQPKAGGEPAF